MEEGLVVFALMSKASWLRLARVVSASLQRRGLEVRHFDSSIPLRGHLHQARAIIVHVCREGFFLETVRELVQMTGGVVPIVVLVDCPHGDLASVAGVHCLHKPYSLAAVAAKIDQVVA